MRLQSWGFDGDSMGMEGSAHGAAGIDAADGKNVNSGSPPRRGGQVIASPRKREARQFYHVRYAEEDDRQGERSRTAATAGQNKPSTKYATLKTSATNALDAKRRGTLRRK